MRTAVTSIIIVHVTHPIRTSCLAGEVQVKEILRQFTFEQIYVVIIGVVFHLIWTTARISTPVSVSMTPITSLAMTTATVATITMMSVTR